MVWCDPARWRNPVCRWSQSALDKNERIVMFSFSQKGYGETELLSTQTSHMDNIKTNAYLTTRSLQLNFYGV